MRLVDAHRQLSQLTPTFTTNDAVGVLRVNVANASKILSRLAGTGHVTRLARGRWAFSGALSPFALPEALTAPTPSYVSLYSALYHHGLIEQIPDVVYAVSLAPTRRIHTPLGTVSLHQVAPPFFTGFEILPGTSVKVASREKALVDVLYLAPARSRLFRALPELELPPAFSRAKARGFVSLIGSQQRRAMVAERLKALFAQA